MINVEDIGINLNKNQIIAIVGAGGKTSLMFDIGKKLKSKNKKVLISTTTKIYIPYDGIIDNCLLGDVSIFDSYVPAKKSLTVSGKEVVENVKCKGYSVEEINKIRNKNVFNYIIIEGDGAKKKSLKAPRSFEPVIPKNTDILLGVIGMDVLNKDINNENIFGLKEFLNITGKNINEKIDKASLIELIINDDGLFKYEGDENYLILNKINSKNIKPSNEIKFEIDTNHNYLVKNTILVEEIL